MNLIIKSRKIDCTSFRLYGLFVAASLSILVILSARTIYIYTSFSKEIVSSVVYDSVFFHGHKRATVADPEMFKSGDVVFLGDDAVVKSVFGKIPTIATERSLSVTDDILNNMRKRGA